MSYTTLENIKIRLDEYDITTVEGEQVVTFHTGKIDVELGVLIEKAKQDIIAFRRYPSFYKDEMIEEDVAKNYSNILTELVIFDYSVKGADYETTHNENGTNRTFIKREEILAKVVPFVKVL